MDTVKLKGSRSRDTFAFSAVADGHRRLTDRPTDRPTPPRDYQQPFIAHRSLSRLRFILTSTAPTFFTHYPVKSQVEELNTTETAAIPEMAAQRNLYTINNSSNYLPAYPPRPESRYEDFKAPAEDDIIDAYTTTAVPLPKQSYNVNSPYLSHSDGQAPLYPPLGPKSSFQGSWAGHSDLDDGSGGGEGSDYHLTATKDTTKEKRSLLQIVLPDSVACRLYVLTVLVETCIDIAIEADLLLRVKVLGDTGDLSSRRLPVYLSIFAFAHLFQLGMAIDAIHARNTLQFMFLTIFNALFLIYAVIQKFEIGTSLPNSTADGGISDIPVNVLTTIIPVVISVAEVAYIALGWKIWREFGWKVYKRLGADRQVKRMYARYQVFVGIMKFDVFFFIGFSVQLIWLVLNPANWEYYVTCAALPCSFLILANGVLAARYENRYMMVTFLLGCAGAMVYFVYKLFRIFQMGSSVADVARTLIVFAIIAITLLIITVVMAVIVLRNFGGGLKYHMSKRPRSGSLRRRGTEHQQQHSRSYPLGNPNRMSID
ncbi:hypothetical protein EW145_g416 [Phellinidium pouzarii]|uniref:TRP C-terminal domain-containing protein n=1 Tax=Phellinidium pouzarii TaxID=167371 RepID=A0A4S4LK78_9AGAM|nr:hypothetical protein EW145_g416 [Phellinidium pouzarii]